MFPHKQVLFILVSCCDQVPVPVHITQGESRVFKLQADSSGAVLPVIVSFYTKTETRSLPKDNSQAHADL